MRVIGYLQVRAVGAVTQGAGFAEQEQLLRAWADRHGHHLVRVVVDRCSTGPAGPGLAAAVAAVRAGEADALAATSRARLTGGQPLGVKALFLDEPAPDAAPRPAPSGKAPRNVRSTVGPWVAIALASAVAAGVASASPGEAPPTGAANCVSTTYEVVPCDGNELARIVEVLPSYGNCSFGDFGYPGPAGTWLCLVYR